MTKITGITAFRQAEIVRAQAGTGGGAPDKSREELLLPKLKEQNMLPLRLHYSSVGPTIGTHIGPGALGIAYMERMELPGQIPAGFPQTADLYCQGSGACRPWPTAGGGGFSFWGGKTKLRWIFRRACGRIGD